MIEPQQWLFSPCLCQCLIKILYCVVKLTLPIKPNTILATYLLTLNPVYMFVVKPPQADNVAFRRVALKLQP